MNPEIFLEQKEVKGLVGALAEFVERHSSETLKKALQIQNMDISDLNFPKNPLECAQEVALAWKEYKVSEDRLRYHPLVSVLEYLLALFPWKDEQRKLLTTLLKKGKDNLNALQVRKAVGCIESPWGTGVGTAVLVGPDRLLTCAHVLAGLQEAWVRFGYRHGEDEERNEEYLALDLSQVVLSRQPLDFAVVTLDGQLGYALPQFNSQKPRPGQSIRVIHHAQGKPLEISDTGKITRVVNGGLHHTLGQMQSGSSGAPIFNTEWEVIALHQGSFSGITLHAIHNEIAAAFSSSEKTQRPSHLHANATLAVEQQSFVKQVESWTRGREISRPSGNTKQAPVKMELDFLGYGLSKEMAKFKEALEHAEGAFAFEIRGDIKLLENYVIKKMLRELEFIIRGRTYTLKEIHLYAEVIETIGKGSTPPGLEVIEHVIKDGKKVKGIVAFLTTEKSQDIVLIIWCGNLPSQQMKSIARSFWSAAKINIWQKLLNRGRRIVVMVVAHLRRIARSLL